VNRLDSVFLKAWQYLNRKFKSASVRLTKLTGKSRVPIHPHHLLETRPEHHWYLEYLKPNDKVLDVGCANAQHTLSSAHRCSHAVGFDYSLTELKRGNLILQEQSINNVSLLIGNAEGNFPFPAAAFDVVLFLDVVEHLVKRDEALQEIYRVLKPEGIMLISAPNEHTAWKKRLKKAGLFHYSDPDHKIEYSQPSLRAEIEQNGFEITSDFMPIVLDTPFAGLIDLIGGVSLTLYRRLSSWKVRQAQRHPADSIGWRLVCVKNSLRD
jgi:SAM-dependent methyltransferase